MKDKLKRHIGTTVTIVCHAGDIRAMVKGCLHEYESGKMAVSTADAIVSFWPDKVTMLTPGTVPTIYV